MNRRLVRLERLEQRIVQRGVGRVLKPLEEMSDAEIETLMGFVDDLRENEILFLLGPSMRMGSLADIADHLLELERDHKMVAERYQTGASVHGGEALSG